MGENRERLDAGVNRAGRPTTAATRKTAGAREATVEEAEEYDEVTAASWNRLMLCVAAQVLAAPQDMDYHYDR